MPAGERHDGHAAHGTGKEKDRPKASTKGPSSGSMTHEGMDMKGAPNAAMPDKRQKSEEQSPKGPPGFPGVQHPGPIVTVPEPPEEEEDDSSGEKSPHDHGIEKGSH